MISGNSLKPTLSSHCSVRFIQLQQKNNVTETNLRELVDGRVVYQGDTDEAGCTAEKHSYYGYISM